MVMATYHSDNELKQKTADLKSAASCSGLVEGDWWDALNLPALATITVYHKTTWLARAKLPMCAPVFLRGALAPTFSLETKTPHWAGLHISYCAMRASAG